MADVTWGTLNVAGTGKVANLQAGEALAEGDAVYKNTDGKWYKAQCDGTAIQATVGALALTAAAGDGSYFAGILDGNQIGTSGTPFTQGGVYVLSATAGGTAPIADLISTNKLVIIGYASTTGVLDLDINDTGITMP